MTVTAALVKLRAPELSTIDDADPRWPDYIAEAQRRVSAKAWGSKNDDGVRLLVAHMMTLSVRNAAGGAGSATARGPVTSEKVGPLARSYGDVVSGGQSASRVDPWLALTPYGLEFASLKSLIFANRMLP